MKQTSRKGNGTTTGEVFTKPEVVAYMMQEVMCAGRFGKWSGLRVLEPSCGEGAFVLTLVRALVAESPDWQDGSLDHFLRACDISEANVNSTRNAVSSILQEAGCPQDICKRLLSKWFLVCDFLLQEFPEPFDVIIGNPPYIRFDDLSSVQQNEYRRRYKTFSERCDIYVPFFERSLDLLSERGVFSFICSNRFAKSSYGRRLRSLISERFHVRLYLNMEHAQPFEDEVSAYPAITVIDRKAKGATFSGTIDDASEKTLKTVRTAKHGTSLGRFDNWYEGDAPWISTDVNDRKESDLITRVYPTIEESAGGTVIGIGVASGADDIFVDPHKHADIEKESLLPLVMAEDICHGKINWHDRYMLNPYDPSDDSRMLDLATRPKTAVYFEENASKLKARYCAKKHPDSWYRTLDRIKYTVLSSAKILLPDIQLGGNVALDESGKYYPHHNVYWITSKTWNMKALCVMMRSSFVTRQIRRSSVQMRGGSIRYQAQNLRNVHVPAWESLDKKDVKQLVDLYDSTDSSTIDTVVDRILSQVENRQPRKCVQGVLFE